MSLRNGNQKMSVRSFRVQRINLNDSADEIARKIRKAKTDPEPLPSEVADCWVDQAKTVGIYAGLSDSTPEDVLRDVGGDQFSASNSS